MTTSLLSDTEAKTTAPSFQATAGTKATADTIAADSLLGAHSAAAYSDLMHETVDALAARFAAVDTPTSARDRTQLQNAVDEVDLDTAGIGNSAALREADSLYAANAVWFHHPSYVAHLNCPVAVPAVAAEAMLAAINTSVDTYDQSEVATLMERRLIRWTTGHLGFENGDGIFTSGGTQSNLQALYLARENVMRDRTAESAPPTSSVSTPMRS